MEQVILLCKKCLEEKYRDMPDLKKICKPCPNILNELKPRKLINRLPDIDMWIICKDGKVEEVEEQLAKLLEEFNMRTSDVNPILAIDDVGKISEMIGKGEELQTILENSRKEVATQNTKEELLDFLLKSATKANFRRFQSIELEKIFLNRIEGWKRPEKGTISKIKESLVEEDQLEL